MNTSEAKPKSDDPALEMARFREEHEYFQLLVENVRDYAIFKLDPEGRVATWNSGAQRMKGYAATEILGQPLSRFYTTEDISEGQLAKQLNLAREGGQWTGEGWRVRKDGSRFWAEVTITALRNGARELRGFAKITHDATERKRTEEALRQSEDRLAAELSDMRRLHKVTTHFIRHGDLRTVLEAILEAATAITGAGKGHVQLLDATSGQLRMEVHQGYDPAYVEFFSHIQLGTIACGTAAQTRQCVVIEDITVHPLMLAEPRAVELMLAAGVRAVVCTPLVAGSGRVVGVLSIHFAASHRPTERDLRLLDLLAGQAADFAERTEAEAVLRATREELKQANANLEGKVQERTLELQGLVEELEHFSYTITHDMRAPLRAMQGFARLMQQDCADCVKSESKEYLDLIRTSASRMDLLITDALQYNKAGKEAMPMGPVDAKAVLQGIIESYPSLQEPNARVRIEGGIPMVLGSEAGMTQCFSNLLGNAVKFVEPGKVPEVRVFAESREGFVRLWFEDNGIGIPAQAHNKLFQMFHRATDKFEGTGIGLALAKKVTERMGGHIGVESVEGQGSRFWVDLRPAN